MSSTVLIAALALELPTVVGFLDCLNRRPAEFDTGDGRGEESRRAWLVWLGVAVATSWILIGYAILLAYYWAVVKRRTPMGRG